MHLLFSRLVIGRDDSSFTFGVHAGFCFKTFAPLNTCQRKQPGKRSISIATPLVFFLPPPVFTLLPPCFPPLLLPPPSLAPSSSFSRLSLPLSFFFFFFTSPTLATNQAQFLLGGLETVPCWIFFFLLSRCSAGLALLPPLCGRWGLLKGKRTLLVY